MWWGDEGGVRWGGSSADPPPSPPSLCPPPQHGSLNKYHGSHPLRERARKLSQGILVIRYGGAVPPPPLKSLWGSRCGGGGGHVMLCVCVS